MSDDPIQDDDHVPTWAAPRLGVHPAKGSMLNTGGDSDFSVSSTS